MALILLRHTRPEAAEGLCYGRSDLLPDEGFGAESYRLSNELPDVLKIVSSPLARCRRLAEAIGAARGLGVECDDRLAEMDFGRWEGLPWDAIPRAELDAWSADFLNARPHGGESVAALAARVAEGLAAAARGPVPALVVTHAGVIKAALAARGVAGAWHHQTGFGDWLRLGAEGAA